MSTHVDRIIYRVCGHQENRSYNIQTNYERVIKADMLTPCTECVLRTTQEFRTKANIILTTESAPAIINMGIPGSCGIINTNSVINEIQPTPPRIESIPSVQPKQDKPDTQETPKDAENAPTAKSDIEQMEASTKEIVPTPMSETEVKKLLDIKRQYWSQNGYRILWEHYLKNQALFQENLPMDLAANLSWKLKCINISIPIDITNRHKSVMVWDSKTHINITPTNKNLQLPIANLKEVCSNAGEYRHKRRGIVYTQLGPNNNTVNFAYKGEGALTIATTIANTIHYRLPATTTLTEVILELPKNFNINPQMLVKVYLRGNIQFITLDPTVLVSNPVDREIHVKACNNDGYTGNLWYDDIGEFSNIRYLVAGGASWSERESFKNMFYNSGIVTVSHPFTRDNSLLDSIVSARYTDNVFKCCQCLQLPNYKHSKITKLLEEASTSKQAHAAC